jgi:hypothetical protein
MQGMPPSQGFRPLTNEIYTFPSIPHPMGTLTVLTRYLTSVNFQLDELESLLSSRFLSLDEGPEFTPTLSKNQQRDSFNITGSPGSLPMHIALPISPPDPGPASVAGRFVLPLGHSRAISLPGSLPSTRDPPPSMSRNISSGGPDSTSGISLSSLGRQDNNSPLPKDDGKYASALPPRLRKESSGTGRGAVGPFFVSFQHSYLLDAVGHQCSRSAPNPPTKHQPIQIVHSLIRITFIAFPLSFYPQPILPIFGTFTANPDIPTHSTFTYGRW